MSEKLRINFVMPPASKISGGPLAILEYANRLADRGHTVSVTTYPKSQWEGKDSPFPWFKLKGEIYYPKEYRWILPLRWAEAFCKAERLPPRLKKYFASRTCEKEGFVDAILTMFGRKGNIFGIQWMLWEALQWLKLMKVMPDCDLNIATYWTTAFPVYFSQKGKPVYFMQHYEEVFYTMAPEHMLQRLAVRMSYGLPIYKVPNSSWLQKLIKQRYGQDAAFSNNGIEISDFTLQPKKSAEDGVIRIVTYARPEMWKGFADAMAVMRRILKTYEGRVEWHVFGYKHPFLPEINPYACYTYHAKLSFRELASLYATSDIALCPSWYESFPLPPIEPMACGTAVITTDAGTEDYAHHEINALIVGARDVDGMEKAVVRLIEDPDLRARLAAAGRRTVEENYAWDVAVDKREAILLAIHRGEHGYDVERSAKCDLSDSLGIEFETAAGDVGIKQSLVYWKDGSWFFYHNGARHHIVKAEVLPELLKRGVVYGVPDSLDVSRTPRGSALVNVADIPALTFNAA